MAALSTTDRSTVRGWIYADALPCGVVRGRTQSELGYTCPSVPWNLPASLCYNQLANNCVPVDVDGDGSPASADCDDTDATVYPGAPEACDGIDANCDDVVDDDVCVCTPTVSDDLGPNYLSGAPYRSDIRHPDDTGDLLVLSGVVYDAECLPVAGATVDVWQADPEGVYDFSADFWYRGVVTTGADGSYELTTYVPGRYSARFGFLPGHIHAIVTGGAVSLTTQLLFTGDPYLSGSEDPSQVTTLVDDGAGGYTATWDIGL
jgi:hypothetical protein